MSTPPAAAPPPREPAAATRSRLATLGASLLVLVLVAGYLVADAYDKVPGFLTLTPRYTSLTAYPSQALAQTPAVASPVGLATFAADVPLPTQAGIEAALAGPLAQPILGGTVAVSVYDALTGRQVYSRAGSVPVAPASATKLLTATAALHTLGPDTRLVTDTLLSGDQVWLRAGGDVTLDLISATPNSPLTHATLADLASQTAVALRAAGKTSVSVALDDTLFSGPTQLPTWEPSFFETGIVAPVTPIAVNIGRLQPIEYSPREADPALAAGDAFVAALVAQGITVGGSVTRAATPQGALPLAAVQSAPIVDLVDYMLKTSDNTIAEVLAHLVAIKRGLPGDFANGGPAVVAALTELAPRLGLTMTGVSLADGSGLSNLNRISPDLLSQLVLASYRRVAPESASIVEALPQAALSGTLSGRFLAPGPNDTAGVLRAKTGTLRHILALSGYVPDRDGRVLVFSIVNTSLPDNVFPEGQAAMDNIAAALANCGCGG
ncbi:D-alanyl-D-alanine carboxypeptidase/D-alanyl-D-alanine-endopeptidase [Micrococcales bacterium 31B]|nr:D-alanyl-D-alanine carboxypeptidase/D-alanyl-D-alanine-endopeptidase [Micrococcales bacterium 31B]